ncbi:DUF697 domain-containing protein [Teichococcus aestuarii]|uniref:DUF697 domain-containing protein n=1 Tax=Teichococcus aestuarii TaxID=568898 RepID=UPI000D69DF9C|nr:DUF697 domain-containing protein [Pseudoroseomonas aestuarii]
MNAGPGWADEPERPRTATRAPEPVLAGDLGPALLPPAEGGLVRHGEPVALQGPGPLAGAGWLASLGTVGLAAGLLVLGSFGLWLGLMVADLFTASPVLGWLGSALGLGVGGLLAVAAGREWRALRRLDSLERLAARVRETPDAAPPPPALLDWAESVARRLPEAAPAVATLRRATTMAEARGLLSAGLLPVLDKQTRSLGGQAARQVFLTTAVLPSPALDAVAMGWLGLRLMRQVAVLHGVRPGTFVLGRLLRRLALSAGLAAGADIVTEAGVEQLVEGHAAKLAGGAAGAAVAARRMVRLAGATALACRPL